MDSVEDMAGGLFDSATATTPSSPDASASAPTCSDAKLNPIAVNVAQATSIPLKDAVTPAQPTPNPFHSAVLGSIEKTSDGKIIVCSPVNDKKVSSLVSVSEDLLSQVESLDPKVLYVAHIDGEKTDQSLVTELKLVKIEELKPNSGQEQSWRAIELKPFETLEGQEQQFWKGASTSKIASFKDPSKATEKQDTHLARIVEVTRYGVFGGGIGACKISFVDEEGLKNIHVYSQEICSAAIQSLKSYQTLNISLDDSGERTFTFKNATSEVEASLEPAGPPEPEKEVQPTTT